MTNLTPSQRTILPLIALGMSHRQIAAYQQRSEHTIRHHIRNTQLALGARDVAHTVALAYETGLLKPGQLMAAEDETRRRIADQPHNDALARWAAGDRKVHQPGGEAA